MEKNEQFSNSFPTLPGVERAESPQKKMRNMKNLSVNTMASNRPASSQLPKVGMPAPFRSPSNHASSAPPTPAFIVPPKVPRKKPSNLGLSITTLESAISNPPAKSYVAPQPPPNVQHDGLRRLQTSSEGPLNSPTLAPEGGMRLPPFNAVSSSHFAKTVPPLNTSPDSITSPIKKQTLEHVKEESDYELPLSQEVKSPAYPQGPVCIYDPFVFLYLEPTKIEAREFDVVLNVAREVLNPFAKAKAEPRTENKMVDKGVQVNFNTADKGTQVSFDAFGRDLTGSEDVTEPSTAASGISFSSALETQSSSDQDAGPSTPKAITSEPEYIHIPWDHNANVVDDLLRLCELIDNRVRQGKKVLVHCQCGVSRSASLVVAYGIYRNPRLTVQEAYDAVKKRSKWIGPNMNLIYQLSEFKGKLAKSIASKKPSYSSLRAGEPDRPDTGLSQTHASGIALPGSSRIKALHNGIGQEDRSSASTPISSYQPPPTAALPPQRAVTELAPAPLSAPANIQSSPAISSLAIAHDSPGVMPTRADETHSSRDEHFLEQVYSPTVQTKDMPPTGAVASDLREVARNLDASEASKGTIQSEALPSEAQPGKVDPDLAPPGSWPTEETESPLLKTKSSLSSLKIGFSRIFSRRPELPQLPLRIRREKPSFTTAQAEPVPFNSVMHDDVPPTPSLLSPRAAEFTASPFHRTAAGDLAGSSVFEQGLMSNKDVEEDPRSPHQRGEAPITRSIFDVI